MHEYPKLMYREGTAIVWEGRSLDTLIACDHAGEVEAARSGWLTAEQLLNGKPGRAPDPLDHDANGRKGGSLSGEQSTARKGRRKKGG